MIWRSRTALILVQIERDLAQIALELSKLADILGKSNSQTSVPTRSGAVASKVSEYPPASDESTVDHEIEDEIEWLKSQPEEMFRDLKNPSKDLSVYQFSVPNLKSPSEKG